MVNNHNLYFQLKNKEEFNIDCHMFLFFTKAKILSLTYLIHKVSIINHFNLLQ